MPRINIISNGEHSCIDADTGSNVMAVATMNNVNGIIAECGGGCSCATCHVYVDASWVDKLEPAAPEESDLLEFLEGVQPNSRLSCQIAIDESLDGLTITVPPHQG